MLTMQSEDLASMNLSSAVNLGYTQPYADLLMPMLTAVVSMLS
jgi:hypothetical protein